MIQLQSYKCHRIHCLFQYSISWRADRLHQQCHGTVVETAKATPSRAIVWQRFCGTALFDSSACAKCSTERQIFASTFISDAGEYQGLWRFSKSGMKALEAQLSEALNCVLAQTRITSRDAENTGGLFVNGETM